MMKNVFYFVLKAFFVLKIFIYFDNFLAMYRKQLDYKNNVNFKTHDVAAWLKENCNVHIAQYLTK